MIIVIVIIIVEIVNVSGIRVEVKHFSLRWILGPKKSQGWAICPSYSTAECQGSSTGSRPRT